MARKRVYVKESPSIELVFEGGETLVATFNMKASLNLQEKIKELKEAGDNDSISEVDAIILWAGINANDETFEYERARELVASMDMQTLVEVTNAFTESINVELTEEQKKTQKALMKKFLSER